MGNQAYIRGKNESGEMAKIVGISISEKKGVPKTNIPLGNFLKDHGLDGDAHAGKWHRQVSLLAYESIAKMIKAGLKNLKAGMFAENLTTEGITLHLLEVGTKLQIGETIMEITQIGKECHKKCAIYDKVGDCVMPKEGVFARVLKEGEIKLQDSIEIV